MANWYADASQAFDGDGTTFSPATIDGGVGAANDPIAILQNIHTYITTFAAGDHLYIRTHDGVNNCSQALVASFTVALPGTIDTPVKVIFDAGVVWPGNAGVFRFDYGALIRKITLNNYVEYYGDGINRRFELYSSYASTASMVMMDASTVGFVDGLYINAPLSSAYNYITVGRTVMSNLKVTLNKPRSNFASIRGVAYDNSFFVNPVIEYLTVPTATHDVFTRLNFGQSYSIIGGKVINPNDAFSYLLNTALYPGISRLIDFDYSGLAGIYRIKATGSATENRGFFEAVGGATPYDFHWDGSSRVEFKSGDNYPYLNSSLPNATLEGWSYKVSPLVTNYGMAYAMPPLIKAFNQTSTTKTLTLEFLIGIAFSAISKMDLFAYFFYVDDITGETISIDSLSVTGNLDHSTAPWTNTNYGAKSYNKYKIEVVTPTAIKQGTRVSARVFSRIPEVGAGDFWFMDPDITIS